jgi:hypothetical protein
MNCGLPRLVSVEGHVFERSDLMLAPILIKGALKRLPMCGMEDLAQWLPGTDFESGTPAT